jgi:hypothetical protein
MPRLAITPRKIRVDNISFIHELEDHFGEMRYKFTLREDK